MPTKLKDPAKVLLLGGAILDRYFEVDRYPQAGQDTLIRRSFDRVGGCSLNVAITLQNLGTLPNIANRMGDDEIGLKIEQYVEAQSLSMACMLKAPGRQTGYCLNILDRAGERTFFTYRGCEAEFSLDVYPPGTFAGFAFAYITGYFLLNRQTASAVLELTRQLRQRGCQVLFDPGALVGEMDALDLRELITRTDWLLPNSNELAIIQQKLDLGQNLPNWLFDQGLRGLIVKMGSHGVEVTTPTSSFKLDSLPIQPVDTTGAGDSFAGGFIQGMVNGYSLSEAVSLANACGAYTCTFVGPHRVFSPDDIQNFITSFEEKNS
jgi:ribokinase